MTIKRLFKIARSTINHWLRNRDPVDTLNREEFSFSDSGFDAGAEKPFGSVPHPLAQYYANLEIPVCSDLEEAKSAWKRLMKKYHPDLHSADPAKRETATELTRGLTEAYRSIEKALKNKVPII